jgi:hypothetical protein
MCSANDLKLSWSKGEELEGVRKFGEDSERQK